MATIMLYVGSVFTIFWGLLHIFALKPTLEDFGEISENNKRVVVIEWVAETFTLCFIGILAFVATYFFSPDNPLSKTIYSMSAVMLIIMAAWTFIIGRKTSLIGVRLICPLGKIFATLLFSGGVLLG